MIGAYLEAFEPLLAGEGPMRSWAVGLGGGGTASVPRIQRHTCTSPSLLLMTLFWGYHSLYGVTVSHHITHHQAA